MLRKIVILLMSLSLCWTTIGCSGSSTSMQSQPSFNNNASISAAPTSISDGKYPVQQATYDDANGEYSLNVTQYSPRNTPCIANSAVTDGSDR